MVHAERTPGCVAARCSSVSRSLSPISIRLSSLLFFHFAEELFSHCPRSTRRHTAYLAACMPVCSDRKHDPDNKRRLEGNSRAARVSRAEGTADLGSHGEEERVKGEGLMQMLMQLLQLLLWLQSVMRFTCHCQFGV